MKIYNTASERKEDFAPSGPAVKMYVCGITPYDSCHLGHAMSYIIFDVIRRYLEFKGYQVTHVQNFTDIDDKIIDRSLRLSIHHQELTERYIQEFFTHMDSLNIMRAHQYPRATQEIPDMIHMISTLMEKGYAYSTDGDVYFRVANAAGYGTLSHRSLDGMMAGARVEVGAKKEHPMDFTLWKAAKAGEPSWDSPWGPGRPGWHIECSTMALKYLDTTVDIHGGGQDLIFPHHENEVAQSESYTGSSPFVRHWIHNGLLQMGEAKMSKSLGNLVTLKEALSRYSPDGIRLFVLSSHYRSPLTYSEEALAAAERGAERLRNACFLEEAASGISNLDEGPFAHRFLNAMDDDFNTPLAISSLFDLARAINKAREEGAQIKQAQKKLLELSALLGITLKPKDKGAETTLAPLMELLIETRASLRLAKEYKLADTIRSRLQDLGILLEDTPKGTIWKYKD